MGIVSLCELTRDRYCGESRSISVGYDNRIPSYRQHRVLNELKMEFEVYPGGTG